MRRPWVPALLVLVLLAGGCTYSENNRAEDLASATPTPLPADTPAPVTEPVGGDDGGDAAAEGDDAAAVPTAVPDPGWVVVEGVDESLNVRGGPGTEFDIIGNADLGVILPSTGNRETVGTSEWVEVTFDGETGWVSANFVAPTGAPTPTPISTPTPLPTPTPAPTGDDRVVDAPLGLNLRTEPSIDASIIRELDDGTVVTPTGATSEDDEGRNWVEVTAGADTGWVSQNFLRAP